ncbi:MAG TPA: hypothetical protein VHU18_07820 [Rhizomicrobium sp.]|jgi:hypothetical protein|nr:hypothetical protein [Rhizomicrobium sp.]
MRKTCLAATAAAGFFWAVSSAQAIAVLVPIPTVPGSARTYVTAINNKNQIAGDFTTPDGFYHGFVGKLNGKYKSFDALSGQTFVDRLSDDGYITGLSNVATDDCPVFGCQYLRSPDGTISEIYKGKKILDGIPGAILPGGSFVGQYTYINKRNQVFFRGYYGQLTTYTSDLTLPFNTDRTSPRGYNSAGAVVGYFRDLDGGGDYPGFVLQDGTATAVQYPDPDAYQTSFQAINKQGLVAGYWTDQNGAVSSAFLYRSRTGKFLPIVAKHATSVSASDINDAGLVTMLVDNVSYLYCPSKRKCPIRTGALEIPEKWISAPNTVRTRLCEHDCKAPARQTRREG